jgi:phosphatidylglycerophosphate synthase
VSVLQISGISSGRRPQTAVPNVLTAARLVLAVLFFGLLNTFLSRQEGALACLLMFACICLTDFFDGALARKLGAATRLGAVFDVTVDCIYVWSSVFMLSLYGVVPWWFLALVVYKFIEFVITSHIFKSRNPDHSGPFTFDPAGRAASVLFFLLPGICIVMTGAIVPQIQIIWCVLAGTSALAAFSSVKKIISLWRLKKTATIYHS